MDEWNKRIGQIREIISAAELCVLGDSCNICPYKERLNCRESLEYDLLYVHAVLETMKRKSYKVKAVKIEKIHI